MVLLEVMGCTVANALIVNHDGRCDGGLGTDDAIFIFVRFIVCLKGVHEENGSLFRSLGLLLTVGLVFVLLCFICSRICCCLCDPGMLDIDTVIIRCWMFLLAPSAVLSVLVLLV